MTPQVVGELRDGGVALGDRSLERLGDDRVEVARERAQADPGVVDRASKREGSASPSSSAWAFAARGSVGLRRARIVHRRRW